MANCKFDQLLALLGTGKWNYLYFFSASYWYMLMPCIAFSGVFMAPNIEHTCKPPENVSVVKISEDSCSYYTNDTGFGFEKLFDCHQWIYDHSKYSSALTTEFNLVCDRSYLRATFQSMTSLASILSSALVGYLTDRYGRKRLVAINSTLFTICSLLVAVTPSFYLILILRFLQGCFSTSTLYVLSLEVCEIKHRSIAGIVMGLPWALGTIAWGGIAYMIRDWRHLQLAISLPYALILPCIFLLDESPRWLILKGRHFQAINVMKRAARWNQTKIPPDHELIKTFLEIQKEQSHTEMTITRSEARRTTRLSNVFKLPKLLSTPKIRLLVAMLIVNLFNSAFVFTGLSLSGNTYSTNPFLYIAIGGLMEVPSYTVTAPIINCMGRKKPCCIGYFICGCIIMALAFIPPDVRWLTFTVAMLGKMSNSAAFMIIFVYMSELLPTEVRLQGTGVILTASSVGSIVAPYITELLTPIFSWLPAVIFGVSSFLAGIVLLPLPETLGKPMPETVDDLDDRGPIPFKILNKEEDGDDTKILSE